MLPFGVTIPATVPPGSKIPEVLMNNPVLKKHCWDLLAFQNSGNCSPDDKALYLIKAESSKSRF